MCIRLRPSVYVAGSNVNLGSFEVSEVKKSFEVKNDIIFPYYITIKNLTCLSASDFLPML